LTAFGDLDLFTLAQQVLNPVKGIAQFPDRSFFHVIHYSITYAVMQGAHALGHNGQHQQQLKLDHQDAVAADYNQRIEALAQRSYPRVALLKQVKAVGTLIALTFLPTLEDPHRFRKSRDVGCCLGLQPGRRNSGQSEPRMHIRKEGDPYLRTLLVQGAQHPYDTESQIFAISR
jgi:hypothetical protein